VKHRRFVVVLASWGIACDGAIRGDAALPRDTGKDASPADAASHDGAWAGDAAAPEDPDEDASVVIAAAGDISDPQIDNQGDTANLVLAGSYDAVLTLGDNQYEDGTYTDFNTYFGQTWGRFKSKIFPALGNHEYSTNTPVAAGGYFDYFFGTPPTNPNIADSGAADPARGYYSFDLGTWHIIALNTNIGATADEACGKIACDEGSAQERWLKADLAAHTQRCTLAYWHQPRFTAGCHADDTDVQALWNDLYAANADVILNGHEHDYQRFVPMNPSGLADDRRGLVEFIVGTGGTRISCPTHTTTSTLAAHENGTYGILRLTLRPASYDYRFVPVAGRSYSDTGSGRCH
jgi:hypothetical protein